MASLPLLPGYTFRDVSVSVWIIVIKFFISTSLRKLWLEELHGLYWFHTSSGIVYQIASVANEDVLNFSSFRKVKDYKLPHKLDILNGFPVIRDTNYGIGRRPTDAASVRYAEGLDPVEWVTADLRKSPSINISIIL